MFRSAYGFGGWGYPRGYLGAGIGYPYMPLVLPFYGCGYPGYGCYGGYGGYGYGYPLYG